MSLGFDVECKRIKVARKGPAIEFSAAAVEVVVEMVASPNGQCDDEAHPVQGAELEKCIERMKQAGHFLLHPACLCCTDHGALGSSGHLEVCKVGARSVAKKRLQIKTDPQRSTCHNRNDGEERKVSREEKGREGKMGPTH